MIPQPVLDMIRVPYGSTFEALAVGELRERAITTIICEPDLIRINRVLIEAKHRNLKAWGQLGITDLQPATLRVCVPHHPKAEDYGMAHYFFEWNFGL